MYGGLQGTGGLGATVDEGGGNMTPVISDYFGNVVAGLAAGSVNWNVPLSSYGVMPGYSLPTLDGTSGFAPWQTLAWRTKRMDPTGFHYMGARYYDSIAERFVSPDPLGFEASMSLYDYANGDPVNSLDPDGRLGKTSVERHAWRAACARRD